MNAVYLGAAELGLGRDYYQKENAENAKTVAEYQKYIASILDVLGYKNSAETAKIFLPTRKIWRSHCLL